MSGLKGAQKGSPELMGSLNSVKKSEPAWYTKKIEVTPLRLTIAKKNWNKSLENLSKSVKKSRKTQNVCITV